MCRAPEQVLDHWRERQIHNALKQVVDEFGPLPAVRARAELEAVKDGDYLCLGGGAAGKKLLEFFKNFIPSRQELVKL